MESETELKLETETERRIRLITSRLGEVSDPEGKLEKIVSSRPLKVYWGTAPTGAIHIGYLVPMLKIADFLDAECIVYVLLADIHASLDSMKSTMSQVRARTICYSLTLREMLRCLEVDISKLRFVVGSEFQYSMEYRRDEDIVSAYIGVRDCIHSGADVVKQSENPRVSGLRYPYMQCLDEAHIRSKMDEELEGAVKGVDAQFGGVDQRKIFMLSGTVMKTLRDEHKRLGMKKSSLQYCNRIHLMNPMIPPLSKLSMKESGPLKMSASSDSSSKIEIIDEKKKISAKVSQAYCHPGDVEDNTPLIMVRDVIFPLLNRLNEEFVVNRPEEYGGVVVYRNYDEVENAFAEQLLSPPDLKIGIVDSLDRYLAPVRTALLSNADFREAYFQGYGVKLEH